MDPITLGAGALILGDALFSKPAAPAAPAPNGSLSPSLLKFSKDILEYAEAATKAELDASLAQSVQKATAANAASASLPFQDFPIDLATLNTAGVAGLPFNLSGVRLIYRREGSAPGGRIDYVSGGRLTRMYPGCVVDAPLGAGNLYIASGSCIVGTALFTVVQLPGYDYREPIGNNVIVSVPPNLNLNASKTIVKDTDPTGATPVGSFDPTGFEYVRAIIDTQTGGVGAVSFDLVPWVRDDLAPSYMGASANTWFEQGNERISVPDTITSSGGRYRAVTFSVVGKGIMAFAVNNLQLPARTGLDVIFEGIR